ncbi:hypothetical protein HJFPF1_06917 [Paramyrothecium foliicola]|nr:hypothetical protein HJFPF1_06917 [Paramyrothecium foliicola]
MAPLLLYTGPLLIPFVPLDEGLLCRFTFFSNNSTTLYISSILSLTINNTKMVLKSSLLALYAAALATATPFHRRAVDQLNEEATQEAHQRDDTATRAFSDVQIKTSDGRCLRVDPLSGDFRANLTPVQIADCGSTDGQGWDIITAGQHNDQAGQMLIVSTLTQACLNFDPRRNAGNQLLLFSCGGRADGGGSVTNSQLFAFNGGAGPLSLTPQNEQGICATGSGQTLDVAPCADGAQDQAFTLGAAGAGNGNGGEADRQPGGEQEHETQLEIQRRNGRGRGGRGRFRGKNRGKGNGHGMGKDENKNGIPDANEYPPPPVPAPAPSPAPSGGTGDGEVIVTETVSTVAATTTVTGEDVVVTQTVSTVGATTTIINEVTTVLEPVTTTIDGGAVTITQTESAAVTSGVSASASASAGNGNQASTEVITTTAGPSGALPTINPTDPVPVSRAGGRLDPTAAAEAHKFDTTAVRSKASVNIRAADGRCLSVDPTAGDFRQNLIPVAMLECADVTSQKFDIVTSGLHNNGRAGRVLLVSVMTDGCISFDPRREEGDKVTVFSCGGRADGGGETDSAQLFPFDGSSSIVLEPQSGRGNSCLVAGSERVDAAQCSKGPEQTYEVVEVL